MSFEIITGDITQLRFDAIVNAANKKLKGGGGVNGAIQRAAGPELLRDSLKLGGCPVGQAKVTGGYKLPCKHIIHAVAPHWCHGLLHEKEKLASCYRASLALAQELGCKTVAFPLLGAGNCGIPYNTAMGIAVREISEYLRGREMTVMLVLFSTGAADQDLSRSGPAMSEIEKMDSKEKYKRIKAMRREMREEGK